LLTVSIKCLTAPVKPPAGVRVMVDVAEAPGLAMVSEVAVRVMVGVTTGTLTVTCAVVDSTILPVESTPEIASEYVPVAVAVVE